MDTQTIFKLVDEKINMLAEQGDLFSASVAISEIKGVINLAWTNCARVRCQRSPSKFENKECRLECQRNAYQDGMTRVSGQRSNCSRTANPQACMNTLNNTIKGMRTKIDLINKQIDATRRQATQTRSQASGRGTTPTPTAGVTPGMA
jgi:hypothetical protein